MLARSQRLFTRQFKLVMEKGRAVHSSFFLLRAVSIPSAKARVSAVVPVKVAKRAVDRNRIRRRIYAAVKPLYPSLNGAEMIIFAKSPAMKADHDAIKAAVRDIFVKAGLLK